METSGHWLPVGSEGQQGGSSNVQRLQATAKPSAGVPRRSSLTLWSLEGEQEFRRSRHRALQHRVLDPRSQLQHTSCPRP